MFLFLDIEEYLPPYLKDDAYPFPFREDNLRMVVKNDVLQIPQLLLELKEYLTINPQKLIRYKKHAAEMACQYANSLSTKDDYLEAIKYYEITKEYADLSEFSTIEYGKSLFKSGDTKKAEEPLSIIEEIPAKLENIDSLLMYIEILKSKNYADKAMRLLQNYSQLKPDHENFWFVYAELETLCSKKTITAAIYETPVPEQLDQSSATSTTFPKLAIISGVESGKTIPLSGDIKIGRGDDNIIQLNDRKVSRHHASLEQTGEGWEITDLGSSNGIYINGIRIVKKTKLNNGDLLLIGETQIIFSLDPGDSKPIARLTTCPKCNNLVIAGARFCGTCGNKLD